MVPSRDIRRTKGRDGGRRREDLPEPVRIDRRWRQRNGDREERIGDGGGGGGSAEDRWKFVQMDYIVLGPIPNSKIT